MPAAIRMASSKSRASIRRKPPRISLVSVNGPSVADKRPLRTRSVFAVSAPCSAWAMIRLPEASSASSYAMQSRCTVLSSSGVRRCITFGSSRYTRHRYRMSPPSGLRSLPLVAHAVPKSTGVRPTLPEGHPSDRHELHALLPVDARDVLAQHLRSRGRRERRDEALERAHPRARVVRVRVVRRPQEAVGADVLDHQRRRGLVRVARDEALSPEV